MAYTLTKLENGTHQLNLNFIPPLNMCYFDIDGLKEKYEHEPITVVKYKDITYTTLDEENIYIEGGENCQGRVSWKAFYLLSVFPRLISKSKSVYVESKGTKVKKSWYEPYPGPDEVKTIKIDGNIKYILTIHQKEKKIIMQITLVLLLQ